MTGLLHGLGLPFWILEYRRTRNTLRNTSGDVIIFVNKVKGPSGPMSMVAGIENPGAMSGE
ncbi:hypothetical protein PRIPAC_97011, partial [Pristionchus pacificus]|uniref:Uncharacterized protein n=1 Tax=Pristionchus pacificus TaxID=54126 RepID=A0A2A6D296_PRIPA